VKALAGTEPVLVGGLNVTFTVSTSSPASNVPFPFESWNTWIVADVNATSVMVSVQLGFGQPGAPGIGLVGCGSPSLLRLLRVRTHGHVGERRSLNDQRARSQ
jgi:hypothetical protein